MVNRMALAATHQREINSRVAHKIGALKKYRWFESWKYDDGSMVYRIQNNIGTVEVTGVSAAEFRDIEFLEQCLILRHIHINKKGRGNGKRTLHTVQKGFADSDCVVLGWVVPMSMDDKSSDYEIIDSLDQQKRLAKWYLKNGWQLLDVERVYAIASLVDFLDRYRGKEVVPTTIGFYGSKTPQVIKDKFDSYSIGFEEHFAKLAN